jgi:signal transduction histidine kinase
MRNALHLLKSPKTSEAMRQRAQEILDRQMDHIVRLVDDLLDVSRIVRGKIDLRREVVDLAQIVSRAVETSQPMLDAHGHRLVATLPDVPVRVHGDVIRLAQVLANLLNNAAKYTSEPGTITIAVTREDRWAVVRVRDPGIGIPPEMLRRVFDLFVQADRSLARSQGGLGIGLTLVSRLVSLHGGRVAARSEGLGKGSEFTVRLPAWEPPPGEATAPGP